MLILHIIRYFMICYPPPVSAHYLDGPRTKLRACVSSTGASSSHASQLEPVTLEWLVEFRSSLSRPAVMTVSSRASTAEPTALKTCRNPRNCVVDSPDAGDPALRPIAFRAPIEQVMRIMIAAIASEPRTQIVVEGRRYLRAEARSALFRFVDDVEFLADENAGLIHFRSASRIGRRDFGVNGRRMRRVTALIRQRFAELANPAP